MISLKPKVMELKSRETEKQNKNFPLDKLDDV